RPPGRLPAAQNTARRLHPAARRSQHAGRPAGRKPGPPPGGRRHTFHAPRGPAQLVPGKRGPGDRALRGNGGSNQMQTYQLYSINGPVVTVRGHTDLYLMEMVYVGSQRLVGEVIRLDADRATIQVYEETSGLRAGEPVEPTGGPLSVTLGPGILRNTYDGIPRPLPAIEADMGSFIQRGAHEAALDGEKRWEVTVRVK